MILETKPLTVEQFDELVQRPENADRALEFIGGEIVEVVSNTTSSEIALTIGGAIKAFLKQHHLGRATGADGGYRVLGERYIPDVGFIRYERQPERISAPYNPLAPDLAVEVLSPTDERREITIKVVNYLRAGTVVWLVDPDGQTVDVYVPNEAPRKLTITDTLTGEPVLPSFSLPVSEIFALD